MKFKSKHSSCNWLNSDWKNGQFYYGNKFDRKRSYLLFHSYQLLLNLSREKYVRKRKAEGGNFYLSGYGICKCKLTYINNCIIIAKEKLYLEIFIRRVGLASLIYLSYFIDFLKSLYIAFFNIFSYVECLTISLE